MFPYRLLVVGFGKMGQALVQGWVQQSIINPRAISIIEPHLTPAMQPYREMGIEFLAGLTNFSHAPGNTLVVLAVKPQIAPQVLPLYQKFDAAGFISIMAGYSLARLAAELGTKAPVIRAMPNLPSTVQAGITVLAGNKEVSTTLQEYTLALFNAVGEAWWLPDEELIDPITAISGSGPAYCFLFMESMVDAAVKLGIDTEFAKKLTLHTMLGSVALATHSPESFATLYKMVASPGGTTEAALNILTHPTHDLRVLVQAAIYAAYKRALELGQNNS